MGLLDLALDPKTADENQRARRPGDVWTIVQEGVVHTVGPIDPGISAVFCSNAVAWCGETLHFVGHAKPGAPTCPTCERFSLPIPAEVIAAAKREPFIHLRGKDLSLRRPLVCDGAVVGFCHPHRTPSGFRLGPLFVLPAYRGRGLTRAAYAEHAAGKACIAYIHDGNVGSEKAHAAAGFTRKRRGKGGWTWVRGA